MPNTDKVNQLITGVLAWWEAHQYDTDTDGCGEEWNLYDETPAFVTLAKDLEGKEL